MLIDEQRIIKSAEDINQNGFFIPIYSPEGYLVYSNGILQDKSLWLVPFSLDSKQITDEPFLLAQHGTLPSISENGDLVYKTLTPSYEYLAWVNRAGRFRSRRPAPMHYELVLILSWLVRSET